MAVDTKELSMSEASYHPIWDDARTLGAAFRDASNAVAFFHWVNRMRRRGYADGADGLALSRWKNRYVKAHASRGTLGDGEFVELFNNVIDTPALEILFCARCGAIVFDTDAHQVGDDGADSVCQNCIGYYFECEKCGVQRDNNGAVTINGFGAVCQICMENDRVQASPCARCSNYFLHENMVYDDNTEEYLCHDHAHRSICLPNNLDFEFPALCTPQKSVREDEIIPITVGHGDVSEEGLSEIINMIYHKTAGKWAHGGINVREIKDEDVLAREWQTKEGNFPKRLAKHLLVEHSFKLVEDFMADIGAVAKRHAGAPGTHFLSITRNLNLRASDFLHEGSCWWGSESSSRCEFKAWNGFGLRTWSTPEDDGHPVSRAWLVPLNISTQVARVDRYNREKAGGHADRDNNQDTLYFSATHVLPADAYVLFNAYGPIEQLPYARMIAGMVGKSYRKIHLGAEMYINAGGVLIAEQSICDSVQSVYLNTRRTCDENCGRH